MRREIEGAGVVIDLATDEHKLTRIRKSLKKRGPLFHWSLFVSIRVNPWSWVSLIWANCSTRGVDVTLARLFRAGKTSTTITASVQRRLNCAIVQPSLTRRDEPAGPGPAIKRRLQLFRRYASKAVEQFKRVTADSLINCLVVAISVARRSNEPPEPLSRSARAASSFRKQ